jgi:hypothetical protein
MYRVTGEYITVVTPIPGGTPMLLGYYRNALLPEGVSDEAIKHHLSTGQIEKIEDPAEAEDTVQSDFTPPATGSAPVNPEPLKEPAKSATHAEWVEYAVSKGADRQDIEDKKPTKADLQAVYGTK